VDKTKLKSILAPYSPPLSPSQVDAIVTEIAEVSAEEMRELAQKKSRRSKSLRDRE